MDNWGAEKSYEHADQPQPLRGRGPLLVGSLRGRQGGRSGVPVLQPATALPGLRRPNMRRGAQPATRVAESESGFGRVKLSQSQSQSQSQSASVGLRPTLRLRRSP